MWTVAYMAQNENIAATIKEILSAEGLHVKLRPIGRKSDNNDDYYEVLVQESEIDKAHGIIIEKGY